MLSDEEEAETLGALQRLIRINLLPLPRPLLPPVHPLQHVPPPLLLANIRAHLRHRQPQNVPHPRPH